MGRYINASTHPQTLKKVPPPGVEAYVLLTTTTPAKLTAAKENFHREKISNFLLEKYTYFRHFFNKKKLQKGTVPTCLYIYRVSA